MTFKSLASPLALAAAAVLALSSASFAQTMVGDQQISDADLPAVKEHCTALAEGVAGDGAADAASAVDANDQGANAEANVTADAGSNAAAGGEAAAGEDSTSVALDLQAITIDDCRAAGLLE